MKVSIRQVYIRADVNFPFTFLMQRWVGDQLSLAAGTADSFVKKYGPEFELIINMSAKRGIETNEVRGPTVYRTDKHVEYSVFLPFDSVPNTSDRLHVAMRYLLEGVLTVFKKLRIETHQLEARVDDIVQHVCAHPEMLDSAQLPGKN